MGAVGVGLGGGGVLQHHLLAQGQVGEALLGDLGLL